MTVDELRRLLADVPGDLPVFACVEGDEGSITSTLVSVEVSDGGPRLPRGVWLPRVFLNGEGDSGMDLWCEATHPNSEDR